MTTENDALSATLANLVGLTLSATGRAGNLQWFQIGPLREIVTPRGTRKSVGTYALHVQCAWRITAIDRVLVGSENAEAAKQFVLTSSNIPGEHDGDPSANATGPGRREVAAVTQHRAGHLQLEFADGTMLEVFPLSPNSSEWWRLIQNDDPSRHWVVSSNGVEEC